MAKYRICGYCGTRNPISVGICACGSSLLNCPVLSDEKDSENYNSEPPSYDTGEKNTKFKECPECHFLNSPQAEFCVKCHESLEDVFDLVEASQNFGQTARREAPEIKPDDGKGQYSFSSTTGYKVMIPLGKSTVGQSGLMGEDIVSCGKFFVSHSHLIVECSEKGVFVTDISRNGTFLNGRRIDFGIKTRLESGDSIGLGGVDENLDKQGYFITFI